MIRRQYKNVFVTLRSKEVRPTQFRLLVLKGFSLQRARVMDIVLWYDKN